MKKLGEKIGFLGIMLLLMSYLHGVAYDMQCTGMFINNKVDRKMLIRFYNEFNDEQQRYESLPNEHREVRLKNGVMQRLTRVSVTMRDPETGNDIMKDLDYETSPKNKIVGLEIIMNPDLQLRWHYEDEDLKQNPSTK